jgi:hypothetical protein
MDLDIPIDFNALEGGDMGYGVMGSTALDSMGFDFGGLDSPAAPTKQMNLAEETTEPTPPEPARRAVAKTYSEMKKMNAMGRLKNSLADGGLGREGSNLELVLDTEQVTDRIFEEGSTVLVADRSYPGMNKKGGVGRVIHCHSNGTYDVKYSMGGKEVIVRT